MATVGKKFTDPDKWDKGFFARLSPKEKLLYFYLWDRCDHAGVIEIILKHWSAHLDEEITKEFLDNFVENLNVDKPRAVIFGNKFWFAEYIRFNQRPDTEKSLSTKHNFHRKVFREVKNHDLVDEINNRDPILLQDFISENADSKELKPSPSLGQGLSRGRSKSISNGMSSSNSFDVLIKRIYKLWPELDHRDFVIKGELERVVEDLGSNDVQRPKKYIANKIDEIQQLGIDIEYNQFIDGFINSSIDNVPF